MQHRTVRIGRQSHRAARAAMSKGLVSSRWLQRKCHSHSLRRFRSGSGCIPTRLSSCAPQAHINSCTCDPAAAARAQQLVERWIAALGSADSAVHGPPLKRARRVEAEEEVEEAEEEDSLEEDDCLEGMPGAAAAHCSMPHQSCACVSRWLCAREGATQGSERCSGPTAVDGSVADDALREPGCTDASWKEVCPVQSRRGWSMARSSQPSRYEVDWFQTAFALKCI